MQRMTVNVTVQATIDYDFKYTGDLTENEVANIIRNKYHGNIWLALRAGFIEDIDSEIVDEILSGIEEKEEKVA